MEKVQNTIPHSTALLRERPMRSEAAYHRVSCSDLPNLASVTHSHLLLRVRLLFSVNILATWYQPPSVQFTSPPGISLVHIAPLGALNSLVLGTYSDHVLYSVLGIHSVCVLYSATLFDANLFSSLSCTSCASHFSILPLKRFYSCVVMQ